MLGDTVSKLAASGAEIARFPMRNPLGLRIGAMTAGIHVSFGILLISSLGSLLDPSLRLPAMSVSFGLALILVAEGGGLSTTASALVSTSRPRR